MISWSKSLCHLKKNQNQILTFLISVNSYNNTIQLSIGMAPSEALFNRPPVLMADVISNNRLPSETNVDNVGEHTML